MAVTIKVADATGQKRSAGLNSASARYTSGRRRLTSTRPDAKIERNSYGGEVRLQGRGSGQSEELRLHPTNRDRHADGHNSGHGATRAARAMRPLVRMLMRASIFMAAALTGSSILLGYPAASAYADAPTQASAESAVRSIYVDVQARCTPGLPPSLQSISWDFFSPTPVDGRIGGTGVIHDADPHLGGSFIAIWDTGAPPPPEARKVGQWDIALEFC